jgi:hypothetical protein
MEVSIRGTFDFSVGRVMKIVKILVPLAFVVFLIGYAKELRHLINEGGWPELAVVLICFGGILICYGVALMPIATKARARARIPRRLVLLFFPFAIGMICIVILLTMPRNLWLIALGIFEIAGHAFVSWVQGEFKK